MHEVVVAWGLVIHGCDCKGDGYDIWDPAQQSVICPGARQAHDPEKRAP